MTKSVKELKLTRITNHAGYVAALSKLARLKSKLAEATASESQITARLASMGASEEVRQYMKRGIALVRTDEAALVSIARAIAEDGEIPDEVMEKLRNEAPAVPLKEKWDVDQVEDGNRATRRLELFKRAVAYQEREVLKQRDSAISELLSATRPNRERLARAVADATLALGAACGEESSFVEELRSQEAEIIPMLRPQPFPVALHENSGVCRYVSLALGISEAEVEQRLGHAQIGRAAQ